ncbi:vitellogenin-1-like [Thalassophryne amazonica]|uniref:vitellogenin-1-like n=1 Tax=Thalassophryne amazonica TaxID=390379 RepID=UPI0014712E1F|nr:vitellogenin-1-like [Thalassophryne amazonica]
MCMQKLLSLILHADVVCPTKTVRCYSTNKPLVTHEVKAVLNRRKAAFRSRDMEAMKTARQEVKLCMREAKDSYRRKMEHKLLQNNMRKAACDCRLQMAASSVMWVIALALNLALVAGQHISAPPPPGFPLDKTYVYKYEAVLLGGLPEEGLAKAGLNISSKVHITLQQEATYVLQLVEPQLFEYIGIRSKGSLNQPAEFPSELTSDLTIPIKFEYVNGIVTKLLAPEKVSPMVMNIYRGILSILQLQIKEKSLYEMEEEGTQGMCETIYVISEHEEEGYMELRKTKNLNKCLQKIKKDFGLSYMEKYPTKQHQQRNNEAKNLEGVTTYDYVLKPDTAATLILNARVTELIPFSPFPDINGAAQMETKQSLVFLELLDHVENREENQYVDRGSLKYEFSSQQLQMPVALIKISEMQKQIEKTVDHLMSTNMEKAHEDAPQKFLELIQLLRSAGSENLETIWRQKKNKANFRKWILDAIPASGTLAALKFIKEKFLADELSFTETVQGLVTFVHMGFANKNTIKLLEELTVNNKITENPYLKEIVYLGYGTMVSKYCADNAVCPEEFVKPLHGQLSDAVSKEEQNKVILLLKVLGNARHPKSLKPLTKILPIFGNNTAALPTSIHAEAIMAIKNLAKKEPRMVQELALQLYMSKDLHPELRMLACIMLFETHPSMALINTVANFLQTEKNLQLLSFSFSHMKSITRSTIHPSVARSCKLAVNLLKPRAERMSYRFSRAMYMDVYNYPMTLGAAVSAFYISDSVSILPKSVMAKTKAYIAGAAADVLEVGVKSEGLQEMFLKHVNINGNVDRITKMQHIIKALFEWKSLPNKRPLISIYIKLLGQEVAFADIDKPMIEQAIALAHTKVLTSMTDAVKAMLSGVSAKFAKSLLLAEVRRIIPTAAGLPMELSLHTAAVVVADVQVKATATPPLPETIEPAQLLKTDWGLDADLKPSVAMNTFAVMGVNIPELKAAMISRVKLNAIAPAKIKVRLDIPEGNFKIEALPVPVPDEVAAIRVETYAASRNILDATPDRIIPLIPDVVKETSSHHTSSASAADSMSTSSELIFQEDTKFNLKTKAPHYEKYCGKAVGIKTCITMASINAAFIQDFPLYKLAGYHSLAVSVKPVEGEAIDKLEMEVQVGAKAAEKLIKKPRVTEEDAVEGKAAVQKLRKILAPGLKNSTSSSSSSSRSSLRSATSSSSSRQKSNSTETNGSPNVRYSSSRSSSRRGSSSSSSAGSMSSSSRSNSFSNFESFFSSSSSSSRSAMQVINLKTFQMSHSNQKKDLDYSDAFLAIIFRTVRANQKMQGYQIGAFKDRPTSRLQLKFESLAEENNWKICADGEMLSNHKIATRISWGPECNKYSTIISAETGLVESNPAARFNMSWNNLPSAFRHYAKKVCSYISEYLVDDLSQGNFKSALKQTSLTVIAATERTLDFVWASLKGIIYKWSLHLPVSLEQIARLRPFDDQFAQKIFSLVSEATSAECSMVKDNLTTFNYRTYKNKMPLSCYQVLAQDCTLEHKFVVLLKKDTMEQKHINVKISSFDIDLYSKNSDIIVEINGKKISNLPYHQSTEHINVKPNKEGISVYAPSHGLQEVYFAKDSWKIKVVDWMKGQTCGICGRSDGEVRQEYRIPNGQLTKNKVIYAQSWILQAENCQDSTECRMKLEHVNPDKQLTQGSTCTSIDPVMRCLPGCNPVSTTPVTVAFRCNSAGKTTRKDS